MKNHVERNYKVHLQMRKIVSATKQKIKMNDKKTTSQLMTDSPLA